MDSELEYLKNKNITLLKTGVITSSPLKINSFSSEIFQKGFGCLHLSAPLFPNAATLTINLAQCLNFSLVLVFLSKTRKQIRTRRSLLTRQARTPTSRSAEGQEAAPRESVGPPAAGAQSLSEPSLYCARMAWPFCRGISS